MVNELKPNRKAVCGEDDLGINRIEIEFAIDVYIPPAMVMELNDWLAKLVNLPANQIVGYSHWVSSYGSKPKWSQADSLFLGKPVDPNAPAKGEPEWDDSTYHIETSILPKRR